MQNIKPWKKQLGLLSKVILKRIANDVRRKLSLTQWMNSYEVLELFNNIDNIKNKYFVNFDIVNFYPSIKHQHLTAVIKFAKNYTEVEIKDIKLIEHTCKTIISYINRTWIKKITIANLMCQLILWRRTLRLDRPISGVGNIRPAGQIWPAKQKFLARELLLS